MKMMDDLRKQNDEYDRIELLCSSEIKKWKELQNEYNVVHSQLSGLCGGLVEVHEEKEFKSMCETIWELSQSRWRIVKQIHEIRQQIENVIGRKLDIFEVKHISRSGILPRRRVISSDTGYLDD